MGILDRATDVLLPSDTAGIRNLRFSINFLSHDGSGKAPFASVDPSRWRFIVRVVGDVGVVVLRPRVVGRGNDARMVFRKGIICIECHIFGIGRNIREEWDDVSISRSSFWGAYIAFLWPSSVFDSRTKRNPLVKRA